MEFDERLQRAFDALATDLHREIAARLASLRADLSGSTGEGTDAAIAETTREVRAAADQEMGDRIAEPVPFASTNAQAAPTAVQKGTGDRLVEAVRTMDGGESLSEILDVLIAASSYEVGRAAIFLPHGQTLRSWRLAGFDALGYDDSSLEFQFADGGMIAEAAESAQSIRLEPGASRTAQPPPLANLPEQSLAVALPLVMSGHVFAVLYADDGTRESAARTSWPGTIEVLARHASRALEAITARRLAQVAEVVAR